MALETSELGLGGKIPPSSLLEVPCFASHYVLFDPAQIYISLLLKRDFIELLLSILKAGYLYANFYRGTFFSLVTRSHEIPEPGYVIDENS